MKARKARARLEKRIASFEAMRGTPGTRKGSKDVVRPVGYNIDTYHRPGSTKK